MKALALDFDGVISDSAREAFVVALRARAQLCPQSRLPRAEGTPAARLFESDLYRDFVALMPLGNRAEDFGVALEALERGAPPADQAAYDAFRDAQGAAALSAFHARFYAVRDAWRREDPRGWRQLLAPYPELLALLRRRSGDAAFAIVTAKDAASVTDLLRGYGALDLFPPGRLLDKESGVHKRSHLARLQQELGLPFEAITFVDDKLNHLEDAAPLGVRCVLAAWGYNGERERRAARAAGFRVATLAEAEATLFS